MVCTQDGAVDPGAAVDGRCDAADAIRLRRTLPHRSETLLRTVDRGPEMVGGSTLA